MNSIINMATEEVLHVIHDMMGKDVTISLTDGNKYAGILAACSPEMSFGLKYAYKITQKNADNLLPCKGEVQDKMQFNFQDVINLTACASEEKPGTRAMGFATDRVYHGKGEEFEENEDLEEWTGEDDEGVGGSIAGDDLPDQRARRNGAAAGWSADEMFAVNEKMNVVSTFKDDLTQYTTVHVEGTEEDRIRADRLAREIEQNQSSRFYAKLENDDIERDLDKETGEDDFEIAGANNRRGKGNQQQQQQQKRNNPNNSMNGQQYNRRAEALKGNQDRRGSGGFNRYNQNNYQSNQQNSSKGAPQYNSNNRRGNSNAEEYRENDWQSNKGKNQTSTPDNSFKQQPKQMLEQKATHTQKPAGDSEKQGSRVAGLKTWNDCFNMASKDEAKHGGPQNSGNAWNRGPPSSLVTNKGGNDVSHDSLSSTSMTQSSPSTSRSSDSAPLRKDAQADASTSIDGGSSKAEPVNEVEPSSVENADNASTAGSTKSAAANFKFNINAPEFKPRTIPTTPQPTTPTGQMQQPVIPPPNQPPPEYTPYPTGQGPVPQNAHLAMQGPPIVGGAPPHLVSNNIPQTQPLVMWPTHQTAFTPYQVMPIHHGQMQRGAQGQMYQGPANGANAPNGQNRGGRQQQQQQQQQQPQQQPQQVYQQQQHWQPQHQGVPIVQMQQGFFQPPFQQGQLGPQQYQMGNPGPLMGGPHSQPGAPPGQFIQGGGQRFHPQQQMYMQQQPQQQQQQQQGQRYQGPPNEGIPNSHPNSQPPTPGPQQGQGQAGQNTAANQGMRQGADSGSNGSLSGSAAGSQNGAQQVRSGSPNNQSPPSTQNQQAPPPQGGPMMAMPPPQAQHVPYMHVPQHQMQMHQPQPYYQQVYYAPPMYTQHGMQMPGPPGNPQFYQPQQHVMSRQNSMPHQQQQYQQGGQGPQQGPPQQPAQVGGQ